MEDHKALTGMTAESETGKLWTPPLETVVFTDIVDTAGNTGIGHDGGSGGFNAS